MKHVHAELIKRWAEDTSLVVECRYDGLLGWTKIDTPPWSENMEYRIRHKHQDLIDQKAARPELIVEARVNSNFLWQKCSDSMLDESIEYRLVEPQKKKVKMWQWVVRYENEGVPYITSGFFKDAKDAVAKCNGMVVQRADWTEIEVEKWTQ